MQGKLEDFILKISFENISEKNERTHSQKLDAYLTSLKYLKLNGDPEIQEKHFAEFF